MARNLLLETQLDMFPAQGLSRHSRNGFSSNGVANRLAPTDFAFHNWYRFVLSFPPHLVREYIARFGLRKGHTVLDPFCGTGTTLVEAKISGIDSIGVEANPMAHFASSVKTDWAVDPDELRAYAAATVGRASCLIQSESVSSLPDESYGLLLKDSVSPQPLHKLLALLDSISESRGSACYRYGLLALAKTAVACSNLHFGPEVGVSRFKKVDAPVLDTWLREIQVMSEDIRHACSTQASSRVLCSDSRQFNTAFSPHSISAVFTSPPYPNEKDYTRTTRLESVLLGFARDKKELRSLKHNLLRSNTRNVYKGDEDDVWAEAYESVQRIAERIEDRRIELGKTSGFERLYARVTRLYFGGMARHLAELRPFLQPGAFLGYVVGDQASYFQVMIRTGQLLGEIAESLGYRLVGIDLFRTRVATATKQQMREEVVVLQWPGDSSPLERPER